MRLAGRPSRSQRFKASPRSMPKKLSGGIFPTQDQAVKATGSNIGYSVIRVPKNPVFLRRLSSLLFCLVGQLPAHAGELGAHHPKCGLGGVLTVASP